MCRAGASAHGPCKHVFQSLHHSVKARNRLYGRAFRHGNVISRVSEYECCNKNVVKPCHARWIALAFRRKEAGHGRADAR